MDLKEIHDPAQIAHREITYFKKLKYKNFICNTCDSTFDKNPGVFCRCCNQGKIITKKTHQEAMIKIIINLLMATAAKDRMDLEETRKYLNNVFKREGLDEWKYLLVQ